MAKPKKPTQQDGGSDAAVSISNQSDTDRKLEKLFGRGIVVSGDDFLDKPQEILSISPAIDEALGGGLLVGTLVTLVGPSGCGKTTTALHMAAKWQQAGGIVYYMAAEMKVLHRDLTDHKGLSTSPDKLRFIRSHSDRILTAGDFLLAGETVLKNEKRAMLIVDSFSILCEETEMTNAEYGGAPPGGSNRLVGQFCRRNAPIIPINDNIVIGIGQIYTNIGGKKKWADSLPVKVKFARTTGLNCTHTEPIFAGSGDDSKQVGQTIHWIVERSAFGPPGRKFDSILRYGVGIDDVGEAIDLAEGLALITKGGSWYNLDFLGQDALKFQGKEKVFVHLSENEAHLKLLQEKLHYYLTS